MGMGGGSVRRELLRKVSFIGSKRPDIGTIPSGSGRFLAKWVGGPAFVVPRRVRAWPQLLLLHRVSLRAGSVSLMLLPLSFSGVRSMPPGLKPEGLAPLTRP